MKVIQTIDTIAKAVVGAGGLAITALQPIYGSDKWYVAAIAAYGALSIYFTKNLAADVTVNSSQQTHQ